MLKTASAAALGEAIHRRKADATAIGRVRIVQTCRSGSAGALWTGSGSCTGGTGSPGMGVGSSICGTGSGTGGGSCTGGAACTGSSSGTSHSQQSLHRPHFAHKWFAQVSLVHHTQMRVDSSPQIVQLKGILLFLRLGS